MAYLLFVDESGQDHRESPYEVLAGVAVEDRDLWNLIKALQDAEFRHFGRRYTNGNNELKAKKVLKRKTFRQANQMVVAEDEIRNLAKSCLDAGDQAGRSEQTALALAKLGYVREALDICARFRCKAFAIAVHKNSPSPSPRNLRKDYAYLFERFFYFLEDTDAKASGIVVFDELEKSQSHIVVEQMDRYFEETAKGRQRASQIIPEPFFVHSDLTTGIQLADLCAYIISWGVRFEGMNEPVRQELSSFGSQVCRLRHRAVREINGRSDFCIWSFAFINDLRPRDEQD